MNITEILKQATALQVLAEDRAKQLLVAHGYKYPVYCTGFEFEDDKINVSFEEDTKYDADTNCESLSILELEMDNNAWNSHIEEITNDTLKLIKEIQFKTFHNS